MNICHNYNGPYCIYNCISIEIIGNSNNYSVSNIYKRIVEDEERIYAFDLKIQDEMLSANLWSLNKSTESLRYSITDKNKENMLILISKSGKDEFLASFKQISEHFIYTNIAGNQVFRIEVEFGDDFFYI